MSEIIGYTVIGVTVLLWCWGLPRAIKDYYEG